ncbi:MAG: iron-sulfur cluster repair di-iron protein [Bacteroidia bacterium]
MKITEENTIGEVVAKDYKLASLFESYKIDFCCGGGKKINEICAAKKINTQELVDKINDQLTDQEKDTNNYAAWPLDLLADYIEKKHHRYVREQIPVLQKFLNKLSKVHGANHPELLTINTLFEGAATELTNHMIKEELILFPYVRQLADNQESKRDLPEFKSLASPISVMIEEHETEGARFRRIAELTDNYTPPADACNTYKAAYVLLQEFEKDLHLHIHLENNILFPKSLKKEKNVEHISTN